MLNFADRLNQAIISKGTPLVVGLDPVLTRLPTEILGAAQFARCGSGDHPGAEQRAWSTGQSTEAADAVVRFCCEVIDLVRSKVAAVKVQAAFFEMLGAAGMYGLQEVLSYARQQGLLVILDAKRGDIGSTAEAYAAAYLDRSAPWCCDALTVNPYLGMDSIAPFVSAAATSGTGLFVLVKTSNPGSGDFQDLQVDQRAVYLKVAEQVQALAQRTQGSSGYGYVGAVVGATYPEQLRILRQAMPHAMFLVPGFGAQGGQATDVLYAFDQHGGGAVVNSSRAIIYAHESAPELPWQAAIVNATERAVVELRAALATR